LKTDKQSRSRDKSQEDNGDCNSSTIFIEVHAGFTTKAK
jgi:hypothetical protein